MTLQYILKSIYVGTIGLSFTSSLVVFLQPKQPRHLKIFSVLLFLTFIVELWASRLVLFFPFASNRMIYHFFFPVEIVAYTWFYLEIVATGKLRVLVRSLLSGFIAYWLWVTVFAFNAGEWNGCLFMLGYGICIVLSLAYFYELLQSEKLLRLPKHTEFWIASGMLLFYLCFLPYFGAINFLSSRNWVFSRSLLNLSIIIDTLMYISFTYSFLCRISNGK